MDLEWSGMEWICFVIIWFGFGLNLFCFVLDSRVEGVKERFALPLLLLLLL